MSWTTYNPFKPVEIPACAGVYVVYFGEDPVYVGQSTNLRSRIYSYKFRYGYGKNIITPWGEISDGLRFVVKCKPSKRLGDWAMWEIRLIHKLKPIFNTNYLKIKRAA